MNILLGKHHDIISFASRDLARYVLNGVHYDAAEKVVETTDGRVLIRVPVTVDVEDAFPQVSVTGEAPQDTIIPVAPFKKALANIPKSTLPILENMRLSVTGEGDKTKINMTTTDLDTEQNVTEQNVCAKPVDGNYPPTKAVIPDYEPTVRIAMSATLLAKIADYAERHGKDANGDVPVTFEFLNELSAVRFSLPLENGTRATGALMPMRMS